MSIDVSDYCSVTSQADKLGLVKPDSFSFLPRNFDQATSFDDLLFDDSVVDLRILFRQSGFTETKVEHAPNSIRRIQQNDITMVLPIIYFSYAYLSQNPNAIAVALGIISNYLTDFFKGVTSTPKAKLDIVIDQKGKTTTKRISYKGDPSGFESIPAIIKELLENDD